MYDYKFRQENQPIHKPKQIRRRLVFSIFALLLAGGSIYAIGKLDLDGTGMESGQEPHSDIIPLKLPPYSISSPRSQEVEQAPTTQTNESIHQVKM